MSEAKAKKAKPAPTVTPDNSPAEAEVVNKAAVKEPKIDYESLVSRHPSLTLRNLFAYKVQNGMDPGEAFADAVKSLGGN